MSSFLSPVASQARLSNILLRNIESARGVSSVLGRIPAIWLLAHVQAISPMAKGDTCRCPTVTTPVGPGPKPGAPTNCATAAPRLPRPRTVLPRRPRSGHPTLAARVGPRLQPHAPPNWTLRPSPPAHRPCRRSLHVSSFSLFLPVNSKLVAQTHSCCLVSSSVTFVPC